MKKLLMAMFFAGTSWLTVTLIEILQGFCIEGFHIQPTREASWKKISKTIIEREKRRLKNAIEIEPLPNYITLDHWLFWRRNKFALRFLPQIHCSFVEKGGQKRIVKHKNRSGWILWDTRKNPLIGKEYDDDQLIGNVLAKLRKNGIISKWKNPKSRFGITYHELCLPKVQQALENALDVPSNSVRISNLSEQILIENVLKSKSELAIEEPNLSREWLNNPLGKSTLIANKNKLEFCNINKQCNTIGFRPIVIFTS